MNEVKNYLTLKMEEVEDDKVRVEMVISGSLNHELSLDAYRTSNFLATMIKKIVEKLDMDKMNKNFLLFSLMINIKEMFTEHSNKNNISVKEISNFFYDKMSELKDDTDEDE